MRLKVKVLMAVAILLLATVSLASANTLYINTLNGSTSNLYTVTTSGAATLVGQIKEGTTPLSITDIAYSPINGRMYAISTTHLYYLDFLNIDKGIVAATSVGVTTGATNLQGLGVKADGTIYAGSSGSPGHLYILSSSTGAATPTSNSFGSSLGIYGDLSFSSGGTLYGMFSGGSNPNRLGTVNTSSGVANLLTGPQIEQTDGLAFIGTTLYADTRDGKLLTLNTTTGAKLTEQEIRSGGQKLINEVGLTYYTAVPLPPSALLMGTGLLGLILLRKRRGMRS
jgi:hypothetical protein